VGGGRGTRGVREVERSVGGKREREGDGQDRNKRKGGREEWGGGYVVGRVVGRKR